MVERPHLKNIRALLDEGFTDEELRCLCYDISHFRSIYNQFVRNTNKIQVLDSLVEHTDQAKAIDILLAQAKELSPINYEKHQPYYHRTSSLDPRNHKQWGFSKLITIFSNVALRLSRIILWLGNIFVIKAGLMISLVIGLGIMALLWFSSLDNDATNYSVSRVRPSPSYISPEIVVPQPTPTSRVRPSPSYVPPEIVIPRPIPTEIIGGDPCQTTSLLSFDGNEEEVNRIKLVIQTELQAFGEQDILTLEPLYLPDAIVINNQGSLFDFSDNLVFIGWENIKQLHYVGLWARMPEGSHKVEARNLNIIIKGTKAIATHDGIIVDDEPGNDFTTYTLVRADGDWKICQLEYGNK